MHSWPSTVLSPMITSPSWQRILVPSPIHTKRPNRTRPRLAIWIWSPLPRNSMPSVSQRQPALVRKRRRA